MHAVTYWYYTCTLTRRKLTYSECQFPAALVGSRWGVGEGDRMQRIGTIRSYIIVSLLFSFSRWLCGCVVVVVVVRQPMGLYA